MTVNPFVQSTADLPQAAPKLKFSQRHRQKVNDIREETRTLHQDKIDRVSRWVEDCERARATAESSTSEQLIDEPYECDGDMEDLLLAVLVARPEYQTVPTAGQVRQFARELHTYRSKLSTLDQTRGYFHLKFLSAREPAALPEYPEDIDDEPEIEAQGDGIGLKTAAWPQVVIREISPADEELRWEMMQEYQKRRSTLKNKVVDIAWDSAIRATTCPNFVRIEAF
ncbi:hypothetical protein M406DRAFT_65982 [Cryphonectria parasitica EP155]|uniref:Uncharacterized protein n=1 Tax=Cryphonectria parasitica (strain ATCC 38755 / EP155) TaxID=660469 RepID=A0A9P5CTU9_CRYP1|nr:uncharacterized protein M406DRAFT_65982 [Cryphonectria parasitica EP155]KAF3769490.1 hypothetical protein M406DRAFT_65982 [Cryphonectria parasitica EP155]